MGNHEDGEQASSAPSGGSRAALRERRCRAEERELKEEAGRKQTRGYRIRRQVQHQAAEKVLPNRVPLAQKRSKNSSSKRIGVLCLGNYDGAYYVTACGNYGKP